MKIILSSKEQKTIQKFSEICEMQGKTDINKDVVDIQHFKDTGNWGIFIKENVVVDFMEIINRHARSLYPIAKAIIGCVVSMVEEFNQYADRYKKPVGEGDNSNGTAD